MTKSMSANMAGTYVILQILNLSFYVASTIYGALTLHTEPVRCPMDSNKNNMRTRAVPQTDSTQMNKPRQPDEPSIGRQRLPIMKTQPIGRNATLRHVYLSPRDKEARRPPLAALINTLPPFGPRLTNTLSYK